MFCRATKKIPSGTNQTSHFSSCIFCSYISLLRRNKSQLNSDVDFKAFQIQICCETRFVTVKKALNVHVALVMLTAQTYHITGSELVTETPWDGRGAEGRGRGTGVETGRGGGSEKGYICLCRAQGRNKKRVSSVTRSGSEDEIVGDQL